MNVHMTFKSWLEEQITDPTIISVTNRRVAQSNQCNNIYFVSGDIANHNHKKLSFMSFNVVPTYHHLFLKGFYRTTHLSAVVMLLCIKKSVLKNECIWYLSTLELPMLITPSKS